MEEDSQPKLKRVRTNPTKKWNFEEERVLIEYLMANRELEKPTAQVYYKRFSAETKVEVDWKLVRAKVRNMRISYNKAKGWEGSTGAGTMDGETMKAALIKMCRFFYELDDIFGARIVENAVIDESLSSDTFDCTDALIEESLPSSSLPNGIENAISTPSSKKGIYSRTGLSDILEMQSEMLSFKKERAEKEFNLKEKEFAIKEREIELREKEIKSNEYIKVMELEMKERLAMEELKLKYK